MAYLQSLEINDTGYLGLPSGTTAQRPASPAVGYTRLNTEDNTIEYFDGTYWTPRIETREDDFIDNTLSEYEITALAGSPSWNYEALNEWVSFNTGDNVILRMRYLLPPDVTAPETGIFRINMRKTADYPSDNIITMFVNETDTTYYRALLVGSAYPGSDVMGKIVNGSITDQITGYGSFFDDETSFHTFEFYYSPDTLQLRYDNTLWATLSLSPGKVITPKNFTLDINQADGYLTSFDFIRQ